MNFKLESWEVPPGADAENLSVPIEFGPVEWQAEQTMISARWLEVEAGKALAFFRPHSSAINYVLTHSEGTALYWVRQRINSKNLGELVRMAMAGDKFYNGRMFYCADKLLITRNSEYYWSASQDFYQKEYPLQLPFDSTAKPSTYIFNWLQEQWNDENSEVRFSWEWNSKTEQEQNRWLGTIVPRWNELHDLLRAAACVAELPIGKTWILDHFDTHNHSPKLLARLQPWRELLQAHFSFAPLPAFYPKFLREYFQMAAIHVQIEGAEVSAHEQLEAALFLRDWLRIDAPDHLHLIQ